MEARCPINPIILQIVMALAHLNDPTNDYDDESAARTRRTIMHAALGISTYLEWMFGDRTRALKIHSHAAIHYRTQRGKRLGTTLREESPQKSRISLLEDTTLGYLDLVRKEYPSSVIQASAGTANTFRDLTDYDYARSLKAEDLDNLIETVYSACHADRNDARRTRLGNASWDALPPTFEHFYPGPPYSIWIPFQREGPTLNSMTIASTTEYNLYCQRRRQSNDHLLDDDVYLLPMDNSYGSIDRTWSHLERDFNLVNDYHSHFIDGTGPAIRQLPQVLYGPRQPDTFHHRSHARRDRTFQSTLDSVPFHITSWPLLEPVTPPVIIGGVERWCVLIGQTHDVPERTPTDPQWSEPVEATTDHLQYRSMAFWDFQP